MSKVRAGRHSVEITHPDRLVFPNDGLTKLDLARYYADVSEAMLRHVRGRPLVLNRYPAGIDGHGFVQQDFSGEAPDWVARVTTPRRGGGSIEHAVCHNRATLVYLVNQSCVTFHNWTSREQELEQPDRLIFDLDPPSGEFDEVRAAAHAVRATLEEAGLAAYVMTTGSRGLHVVAPLRPSVPFEAVRSFGRKLAAQLSEREPDRLTVEQRKAKRRGRLYLDLGRNAYGQTAVAPYSVRPFDGAPVATPLGWDELDERGLTARTHTVADVQGRLAEGGDPWSSIDRHRRALPAAARG
jgi:bifunctional non-homologous end joining protein LigD